MNEGTPTQDIPLPEDWCVERVAAPDAPPLSDLHAAVYAALMHPLGTLPFPDLVSADARVCIAVDGIDDAHRAALEVVLDAIFTVGVPATHITVLTTRPGFDPHDLPVAQALHDAADRRLLDALGRYEGVPFTVNHHATDADLLIGIGTLRLDDLLGDAGSQRFLTHDLAGIDTQHELADTRFLDDRVSPWRSSEALYDRVVHEGARRAGLDFIIDLLFDEFGNAVAVKAGAPQQVNAELCLIAHSLREAAASRTADLLVADVGPVGFYSAARAPIHFGMAPDAALVRGGVVVLPDLRAEPARPSAEAAEVDAFYEALDLGANSDEVIRHLSGRPLRPGEARAYLLAQVLQRHPVIAVSPADVRLTRHVIAARDIAEATELAETLLGRRPHTLILSRALSSLPVASRFAQPESDEQLLADLLDELEI